MANVFQRKVFIFQFSKLYRCNQLKNTLHRSFFSNSTKNSRLHQSKVGLFTLSGTLITGIGTICYFKDTINNSMKIKKPFLVSAASNEDEVVEVKTDLSLKQIMFEKYASYDFNGKAIMSPKDFLDSLVDSKDRPEGTKSNRKILNIQDVNKMLNSSQYLPKNKDDFFTYMGENGIITYPEYLFLLTLLTKSSHGLHVAFRMLDLDGNETLGKTEFQQLEKMLNKKASGKSLAKAPESLKSKELPNTSLLIHFFGNSGAGQLTFTDMLHFTRNLQREFSKREFPRYSNSKLNLRYQGEWEPGTFLLHVQYSFKFLSYSGSHSVIDGEQFATLLLHCTHLNDKDIKEYIERLKSRQGTEINVSLQDYVKFGEFLNNLEEFSISLKIYNVANQPVTQEEFKRAARISTGEVLEDHIVNTIFLLFDIDGDGKLSQKEFLGLMKDRVHKRFANRDGNAGLWDGFLNCVKEELVN